MSNPHANLLRSIEHEVRRFIAAAILTNERIARQLGLNGTDLQCLNLLDLRGSATPGELARCCSLTTGGVTVVLDRLEWAGYIRRERSSRDRRSTIVRLTSAKAAMLHRIYRSYGDDLKQVLLGYKKRELELIVDFLRQTAGDSPGPARQAPRRASRNR